MGRKDWAPQWSSTVGLAYFLHPFLMRRSSIAVISVSLLALAACEPTRTGSVDPASSNPSSNGIRTEMIQYGSVDGVPLMGYIASPEGSNKRPALILIHEWWGLNDNMKEFAEQFATEGYTALAVDLYEGKVATTQDEAGKLATAVRGNTERALDNLAQSVAFVRTQPGVDTQSIASVGWCFGGGWSYQMAKNDLGIQATVMYYGQFDPHDDFAHMKSTIQGHFGEQDMSIKVDDVKEFQAKLKTANGEHEVYIYPNAGHGFANANNTEAYNPEAAELAWTRTLEFLRKTLP